MTTTCQTCHAPISRGAAFCRQHRAYPFQDTGRASAAAHAANAARQRPAEPPLVKRFVFDGTAYEVDLSQLSPAARRLAAVTHGNDNADDADLVRVASRESRAGVMRLTGAEPSTLLPGETPAQRTERAIDLARDVWGLDVDAPITAVFYWPPVARHEDGAAYLERCARIIRQMPPTGGVVVGAVADWTRP